MGKVRQDVLTILDGIGIKTAAFTAATTDICTSTAHGLVNGNMVVLTTTDTLPAGLSLATVYFVEKIDANTFYLSTRSNRSVGDRADVTDTGTGTHTFTMHDIGHSQNVERYKHCVMQVASDGGADAALTIKFQGSVSDACPDFSAAASATNLWDYVQVADLEDSATIDGDTGIAFSSADDYRNVEMNINHLKWINVIISGWTAGEVTVKAKVTDNN